MRRVVGLALMAGVLGVCACTAELDTRRAPRDRGMQTGGSGGVGGSGVGGNGGESTPGVGVLTRIATAEEVRSRCNESRVAPAALRRLTRGELENTVAAVFPSIREQWSGVKLGPDPLSHLEFTNDAGYLMVGPQTAQALFRTAQDVATLVTAEARLSAILPCASTGADLACAEQFIDTFGPKLYRRPLEAQERRELVELFASAAARADFSTALKWTLVAMLQAPAVVYRSELGDADGNLTQYELATQLAYTYGGTAPSDALLQRAAEGSLDSPQALRAVAEELLGSETGQEMLRQFFREWVGYRQVLGTNKDLVANFAEVQASLVEETRRFIDAVVLGTNETNGGANGADPGGATGGVRELLTAPFTFVDTTLATYYGFGNFGTGFERVERPPGYGVGLLAQGSVLASTAHPGHTSPTFRGLLIYTRVLCNSPPDPPPVVPPLDAAPPANTTRELYETAHMQDGCNICHERFDPLGFAFEHFDETGRYRETENGFAIDASGSAIFPDGSTVGYAGFDDLVAALANDASVVDCVSGLLATYAFAGAGGEVCLAEDARTALASGEIGLRELYLRLVAAPSFMQRRR